MVLKIALWDGHYKLFEQNDKLWLLKYHKNLAVRFIDRVPDYISFNKHRCKPCNALLIRDNPRFVLNIFRFIQQASLSVSACSFRFWSTKYIYWAQYTGCPINNDTVNSKFQAGVMSTKFQTLCRKPCSIRLSSSEDKSVFELGYIITHIFRTTLTESNTVFYTL